MLPLWKQCFISLSLIEGAYQPLGLLFLCKNCRRYHIENAQNKAHFDTPGCHDAAQPAAHHGLCRDRHGQGHYDHDQSSVLVHAYTGKRNTVQLPPAGGGFSTASTVDSATTTLRRHTAILLPIPRLPMQTPMPFSKPLLPTAALARWTRRRSPMSSGS
mgnify:CR=1 FL=1